MAPYVKSTRQYSESASCGREPKPLEIGDGPRPTCAEMLAKPDKPRVRQANAQEEAVASTSLAELSSPTAQSSSFGTSASSPAGDSSPTSGSGSFPASWADYEGLDVEDWADEVLVQLGSFEDDVPVLACDAQVYTPGPDDLIDFSESIPTPTSPASPSSSVSSVRILELGPRIVPYFKFSNRDLAFLDDLLWDWKVEGRAGDIWD